MKKIAILATEAKFLRSHNLNHLPIFHLPIVVVEIGDADNEQERTWKTWQVG
jgi:hypothetical protein